jgi:hypothetical protein
MPDDAMTSPEQRAEVEAVKVEQDWWKPYRTRDASGSADSAAQVGWDWLNAIASDEQGMNPDALMIDSPHMDGGNSAVLYRNRKPIAAMFVIRDQMNFAVLFRWRALAAQSARPPADQDEVEAVARVVVQADAEAIELEMEPTSYNWAAHIATAAIEALRPFREAAEAKAREDAAKVVIGAWPLGCAAVCAAIRALPAPPALEQGDAK